MTHYGRVNADSATLHVRRRSESYLRFYELRLGQNRRLTPTARCVRNYKLRLRFTHLGKGDAALSRCNPLAVALPDPNPSLPLAASGRADQHHRGDFALPARQSCRPSLPHRSKGAFKPPLNTPDHSMETNPSRIGCAPAFRRWIRPGRVPPMDPASGVIRAPEPTTAVPAAASAMGRACPLNPSLYPRDQPFADWMRGRARRLSISS